jgi:hypothetical protein
MPVIELSEWISEHATPNNLWYVKRLAANDTRATKSKQYGPYVPKDILFRVLPSLRRKTGNNPDALIQTFVDSHPDSREVRAVWYNSKRTGSRVQGHKGHNARDPFDPRKPTRDEARLTRWGGVKSALIDPDSTGSLAVFVFVNAINGDANSLHVWVSEGLPQEEAIQELVGPVEPGRGVLWRQGDLLFGFPDQTEQALSNCALSPDQIPSEWYEQFPSPDEIVLRAVDMRPLQSCTPDERLVRRRGCEFDLFRSVEAAIEAPRLRQPFSSLDEFLDHSRKILRRRQARSHKSLEYHTREILVEEGFREGRDFIHERSSPGHPSARFLFPALPPLKLASMPPSKVRVLSPQTTLKARWNDVLNASGPVLGKHVLTVQEGVSESEFREMTQAGVSLVVPTPLHNRFPKAIRPHLSSLEGFLAEVRLMTVDHPQ